MNSKLGVDVFGLHPETLFAMLVAKAIVNETGYPFVITSVIDGKHMEGSLHKKGYAFDFRTVRVLMPKTVQEDVVQMLKFDLGRDYDVVREPDHIHVEYDRKTK